MKAKVSGLEEILENIKKFEDRALKEAEKAVRETAKNIVKPRLEKNTPYDRRSTNPSHLRNNVIVTMRKVKNEGYRKALVTFSSSGKRGDPKDVRWRAGFVEWGTINQRPQAFMYKTASIERGRVNRELERRLRSII